MLKGKKILAVLLAVIMMLSVTPMALADGTDAKEIYLNAMVRYYTLGTNIYEGVGVLEISPVLDEALDNIKAKYNIDEEFRVHTGNDFVAKYPEAAMEYAEVLNEFSDNIDKFVENQGWEIRVSACELVEAYFQMSLSCDLETIEDFLNSIPRETLDRYYEKMAPYSDLTNNPVEFFNCTQAEYDEASVAVIEFYNNIKDCLDNEHDYGAPTNSDKDCHTLVCDFCGETLSVEHTYENGECVCGATEGEDLFDALFDLLNMLFELIISLFK